MNHMLYIQILSMSKIYFTDIHNVAVRIIQKSDVLC